MQTGMIVTRKVLVGEAKILGAFTLFSVVQVWLTCRSCVTIRSFGLLTICTLLLWIFLWRGNSFLADYLSEKISWLHEPVKRFTVGLVVTIGYTLLAVFLLITVFETFFGLDFGGGYRSTIIVCVLITLLISLFLHSREFLNFWRKAAFDSAKFQRESIAARYEILKNRVNPAFLFHSLNTLSDLVPTDEDRAVKYIKQLADVYRYMLDTREKEAASIAEETTFMNQYAALVNARYGTALHIDISPGLKDWFILPLATHMIIECVLAGGTSPNSITIKDEQDGIRITFDGNPVNENIAAFDDVMNKIKSRYAFVSDASVTIDAEGDRLTILLPVMKTLPAGGEVPLSKLSDANGDCG